MSWIDVVSYPDATGRLRQLYDRVKGPGDNVDNIMMAHSLRPHTMEGHMYLYKYVLHHNGNHIPKWFLEVIGVYVSLLNRCHYCVEHHFAGLTRLLNDADRAQRIRQALESVQPELSGAETDLADREHAALIYVRKLTLAPQDMAESDIRALRKAGWDDGCILEINQVCAYFAYANRTVLGLGVSTDGDILGLSPGNSDDPANWSHR